MLSSIILSESAHAEEVNSTRIHLMKPTTDGIEGSFDFSLAGYVSADRPYFGSEEKSTTMPTVGASLYGHDRGTYVDGKWFYSTAEETHYFDVRELSRNFHRENYNLWFGRHLEEWSAADSFWHLGYWQPRFNWDKLRPDENGLTGIFIEPEVNNNLRLSIFVTPVFVPEIGPSFSEKDGRIQSQNPWFKNPPPIVELWQRQTPMQVSVNTPSITETIFKPSIALKALVHADDDTWLKASYAYKPMNTPLTAYSYTLDTLPTSTYMNIEIEPQFIYHHIATLESQMTSGDLAVIPSLTYDAPQVTSTPKEWIAQDISPSLIGSLTLTWHPNGAHYETIYGGAMYSWSQFPPDRGENAQNVSQFELRPNWLSALRVGYDHMRERLHGGTWGYGFEGTVDPRQNGGELLSQLRYAWDRQWQSRLHADFIGVFSEASNTYETGFIQNYRANSTVGLDVSYVY